MKLSIQALSFATGITDIAAQQLRAWAKESHKRTLPRSSRKRRLTEKDIAHLQLFREAKDRGYLVEDLLKLSDDRLRLLSQAHASIGPFLEATKQRFAIQIQRFLGYVDAFDEVSAERLVAQQALYYQPREFVYGFVLPLITQLKSRAQTTGVISGQERLVVNVLRSLLSTLNRIHPGTKMDQLTAKKILFTTLQFQDSEIEILTAAILSRVGGVQALYFGAGLDCKDLLEIQKKTQPDCIVWCRSEQAENSEELSQLVNLRKSLPLSVQVLGFGPFSSQEKEMLREAEIWVLQSFPELDQFLLLQGAAF